MLGHVDELTGEINRVAADLETKREAIKGSGMQAIDKLTNKARAMATDFLAHVSERVARADGTLSLELRRKLEGLQGLLTRNTEAIGTAEKKAESGMEEGELRLAELGNRSGIYDTGGDGRETSANFERLVLGCIEADFAS